MLIYKIFLDIHIYVDKNFLKDFTKIKREERNVLFQLGNALIHSFGLFTRDSNGKEYLFTLTSIKKQKLIEKVNEKNLYVIGDKLLHHEFEEAVIKYHKELLKNIILQKNFETMFSHHSTIYITK